MPLTPAPTPVDRVHSSAVVAPLVRPDGPLAPVLKWPGGKRRERPHLLASWPTTAGRYLEPFVGGGAMWLATDPEVAAHVNDASDDLVAAYRAIQGQDQDVLSLFEAYAQWWDDLGGMGTLFDGLADLHGRGGVSRAEEVVEAHRSQLERLAPSHLRQLHLRHAVTGVPRKLERMAVVQRQRGITLPPKDVRANVEGAIRAAAYTAIRADYNRARGAGAGGARRVAAFLVLRDLAYASMFRFNSSGGFNVPYGGMSYNRRDLLARLAEFAAPDLRRRLETTTFHLGDFDAFLDEVAPRPDDFVFLDPPYLSDFSDYDGNGFGPDDHRRLAAAMRDLPCRFQLVIKATPEVRDWYAHPDWEVRESAMTYAWTIKSRNDRRATHLVIEG